MNIFFRNAKETTNNKGNYKRLNISTATVLGVLCDHRSIWLWTYMKIKTSGSGTQL